MTKYTDDMAYKARMRHENRSPDERVTLGRAMLSSLARDNSPAYFGSNPEIWTWALETLAYFVASSQAGFDSERGELPISRELENEIVAYIRRGIQTARRHRERHRESLEEYRSNHNNEG